MRSCCIGGRNASPRRCRVPIVREGGRAENGCSVHWAFVPSMLIAAGGEPRKLDVPSEAELAGGGVLYCAIRDGPLLRD